MMLCVGVEKQHEPLSYGTRGRRLFPCLISQFSHSYNPSKLTTMCMSNKPSSNPNNQTKLKLDNKAN